MIDVNTFFVMLLYVLGSILLVSLIVLIVKLIHTVERFNGVLDEINLKLSKFDRALRIVDVVTDNMSVISDKVVDAISTLIRKIFSKNEKRKDAEINE